MNFVYIPSQTGPDGRLFTVGRYDDLGRWTAESDHSKAYDAGRNVHALNAGCLLDPVVGVLSWKIINSEPGLWTVGFADPKGQWHPDSDHKHPRDAELTAQYLNGETPDPRTEHWSYEQVHRYD